MDDFYNALLTCERRVAFEQKIQEVDDKMVTTRQEKSLNTFDDRRFYINKIRNNPHDKKRYLFLKPLIEIANDKRVELDDNDYVISVI